MKPKKKSRKAVYEPPRIKKLNPYAGVNIKGLRFGKAQPPSGPPSVPGPAATSPSTPGATVF